MDKVEVTEDMRNRILQNIAKEFSEDNNTDEVPSENKVETPIDFSKRAEKRKKSVYFFTRYIGVAAAAVVILIGAAAVFDNNDAISTGTSAFTQTAQELTHEAAADLHVKETEFIKNSWVKYESVEKIAQATGIDYTEIQYLSSVSSEVDYYLDNGTDATIVYDVSGNSITVTQKKAADAGSTVETETVAGGAESAKSESVAGDAKAETDAAVENAVEAEKTAGNAKAEAVAGSAGKAESEATTGLLGNVMSEKPATDTITVGDVEVKVSGTDDGYNRAFWTVDGIEYSLDSAENIDLDEMTELMSNILSF